MEIIFLNKFQASKILAKEDDFIKALSPFDRSARLKTEYKVSTAAFLDYISKQTLNFGAFESSEIESILKNLKSKFSQYNINLPKFFFFIKTSGLEEGNAAYCRGNAIILPQTIINAPYQLKNIIIHEIFHIFSKNNPKKQRELYNSIGFFSCPELKFPDELINLKITNPDAPFNNSFMEVSFNDENFKIIPILYSKMPYNKKKGGEFFDYLQFRLLKIEVSNGSSVPIYDKDKLSLFTTENFPEFFLKIGMNTEYIIHPEEILADNFVLLINDSKNIKSLKILKLISEILIS
ncbi:MAG: hypothetical protein ACFFAO_12525 [Candidatus Hermodarchaeota archaeon]